MSPLMLKVDLSLPFLKTTNIMYCRCVTKTRSLLFVYAPFSSRLAISYCLCAACAPLPPFSFSKWISPVAGFFFLAPCASLLMTFVPQLAVLSYGILYVQNEEYDVILSHTCATQHYIHLGKNKPSPKSHIKWRGGGDSNSWSVVLYVTCAKWGAWISSWKHWWRCLPKMHLWDQGFLNSASRNPRRWKHNCNCLKN